MGDVALALRLGWTWQELEDTPDWVVRDMRLLLNAEAEVQRARNEGG